MFEFALLEWDFKDSVITLSLPKGKPKAWNGAMELAVQRLNELGAEGWEVASCTSGDTWVLWTISRERE